MRALLGLSDVRQERGVQQFKERASLLLKFLFLHLIVMRGLLLALALLASASAKSKRRAEPASEFDFPVRVKAPPVALLTADTFADAMGTPGTAWLVAFTAPWCVHCKRLEPAFEAAAKRVAAGPHAASVRFAKVDGTQERALTMQHGVAGYPTMFHINGTAVRRAEVPHTADQLAAFAVSGWQEVPPLSLARSPFGPVGRAKFTLVHGFEVANARFVEPLGDWLGVPSFIVLFGYVLFGVMGLTGFLICCAVAIGPSKGQRRQRAAARPHAE